MIRTIFGHKFSKNGVNFHTTLQHQDCKLNNRLSGSIQIEIENKVVFYPEWHKANINYLHTKFIFQDFIKPSSTKSWRELIF